MLRAHGEQVARDAALAMDEAMLKRKRDDGYTIAERIYMTIQRRNDSDPRNNQVQFHIRRRLDEHIEFAPGVLARLENNDHQAPLD